MTRSRLLMGASALITAASAIAASASAALPANIYGGGSSLIAPYLRQAGDCEGNTELLYKQGSVLNGASSNPTSFNVPYFDYQGAGAGHTGAFTCPGTGANAPDANTNLLYFQTGSGPGQLGFLSHDAFTYFGDTVAGSDASAWPSVQYAMSDAGLDGTGVGIYTTGGTLSLGSGTTGDPVLSVTIEPTGTTGTGGNGMGGGDYTLPHDLYGSMIEIPVLITPVTLAYSSVYSYSVRSDGSVQQLKFNVKKPNKDGSGGLLLTMPLVCAIFNGAVTNWNDPAITYLNTSTSLEDTNDPTPPSTWGLPIELVGRSDSSGTTSIFYRALAKQCPTGSTITLPTGKSTTETLPYSNNYASGGSLNLPTTLIGNFGGPYTAGKFSTMKGSSAIAKYLSIGKGTIPTAKGTTVTMGQIGYIGPDYVEPAVGYTGLNTYALNVADIKVTTTGIEPTYTAAAKAFGAGTSALRPPQASSSGAYAATGGTNSLTGVWGVRSSPQDWVEPISTTTTIEDATMPGSFTTVATPLADPTVHVGAYPIVGTTDGLFYTCYSDPDVATKLKGFLTYYYGKAIIKQATTGLLNKNGFAVLPPAWVTAITQSFITPLTKGVTTNQLNLNILPATATPATGTGSQCTTTGTLIVGA